MSDREIQIPIRPFFYTLDQIASMLQLGLPTVMQLCYFPGRSIGKVTGQKLLAVNIAPPHGKPDWRVEEREFLSWIKRMQYTKK